MKRAMISSIILMVLTIISLPAIGVGDTGTYEIEDYIVTMAPKENGSVEITYYQKWKVTGGHIPWITVGMANSAFSLIREKTGKNIISIKPQNSRSWSGVHITLDKNYQVGETFEVKFTVLQNGLFCPHNGGYRLHFIPGWYDRAVIKHMAVTLNFFAGLGGVSAKPKPDMVESQSLSWEKFGLRKGTKFPLSIVFPKSLFPGKIPIASSKKVSKSRSPGPGVLVFFILVIFIILIVAAIAGSRKNRYGSGGKIRTGGTAAILGRGGCVVSCACACVACACACACAGGGAAGCDRKLTFNCPLCKGCEKEDCPIRHK
jgi:hypothetical protein